MTAEGARAGARNVDQEYVNRFDRGISRIADERHQIHVLQSPLVRQQSLEAREGFVARHYGSRSAGKLERLSTRSSAEIGNRRSHRNRGVLRHPCCRRIMNEEEPFLECPELGET